MKDTNPLVPQGSLAEQKNQGRARVRLAFFVVIGIHIVGLTALLMVGGCKREQPPPPPPPEPAAVLPSLEPTNLPPAETNLPVAAPVVQPPAPVPPPPVPPAPQVTEYTIVQGDSFYTIAKKLGVPRIALMDANPGVDPHKLQIGSKLVVPAVPAAPAVTPGALTPTEPGETVYVVKSGDTLGKIARQYGTTVTALMSANNLTTTKIKVGDKLKIPAKAAPSAPAPTPAAPPPYSPPATPAPPTPTP